MSAPDLCGAIAIAATPDDAFLATRRFVSLDTARLSEEVDGHGRAAALAVLLHSLLVEGASAPPASADVAVLLLCRSMESSPALAVHALAVPPARRDETAEAPLLAEIVGLVSAEVANGCDTSVYASLLVVAAVVFAIASSRGDGALSLAHAWSLRIIMQLALGTATSRLSTALPSPRVAAFIGSAVVDALVQSWQPELPPLDEAIRTAMLAAAPPSPPPPPPDSARDTSRTAVFDLDDSPRPPLHVSLPHHPPMPPSRLGPLTATPPSRLPLSPPPPPSRLPSNPTTSPPLPVSPPPPPPPPRHPSSLSVTHPPPRQISSPTATPPSTLDSALPVERRTFPRPNRPTQSALALGLDMLRSSPPQQQQQQQQSRPAAGSSLSAGLAILSSRSRLLQPLDHVAARDAVVWAWWLRHGAAPHALAPLLRGAGVSRDALAVALHAGGHGLLARASWMLGEGGGAASVTSAASPPNQQPSSFIDRRRRGAWLGPTAGATAAAAAKAVLLPAQRLWYRQAALLAATALGPPLLRLAGADVTSARDSGGPPVAGLRALRLACEARGVMPPALLGEDGDGQGEEEAVAARGIVALVQGVSCVHAIADFQAQAAAAAGLLPLLAASPPQLSHMEPPGRAPSQPLPGASLLPTWLQMGEPMAAAAPPEAAALAAGPWQGRPLSRQGVHAAYTDVANAVLDAAAACGGAGGTPVPVHASVFETALTGAADAFVKATEAALRTRLQTHAAAVAAAVSGTSSALDGAPFDAWAASQAATAPVIGAGSAYCRDLLLAVCGTADFVAALETRWERVPPEVRACLAGISSDALTTLWRDALSGAIEWQGQPQEALSPAASGGESGGSSIVARPASAALSSSGDGLSSLASPSLSSGGAAAAAAVSGDVGGAISSPVSSFASGASESDPVPVRISVRSPPASPVVRPAGGALAVPPSPLSTGRPLSLDTRRASLTATYPGAGTGRRGRSSLPDNIASTRFLGVPAAAALPSGGSMVLFEGADSRPVPRRNTFWRGTGRSGLGGSLTRAPSLFSWTGRMDTSDVDHISEAARATAAARTCALRGRAAATALLLGQAGLFDWSAARALRHTMPLVAALMDVDAAAAAQAATAEGAHGGGRTSPQRASSSSSSPSSSLSEGPAEVLAAVLRGAEAVGHAYARAALATSAAPTATATAAASHPPPPPLDAKRATALLRGHILAAWPAMGALLEGTLQARRRHPCLQRFADPAALLLCLLYTVPLLAVAVGVVAGLLIGSLCIQSPGQFRCSSQGEGAAVITGAFLCMAPFLLPGLNYWAMLLRVLRAQRAMAAGEGGGGRPLPIGALTPLLQDLRWQVWPTAPLLVLGAPLGLVSVFGVACATPYDSEPRYCDEWLQERTTARWLAVAGAGGVLASWLVALRFRKADFVRFPWPDVAVYAMFRPLASRSSSA